MSEDESRLPIATLISMAGSSHYIRDPEITSRYLGLANAKMGTESIKLAQRAHELTDEQIKVSSRANELSEALLLSNEQASKQSERSARLMYNATEQLAKSTRSLNRATWALVAFTAVQALIAIAALYISISSRE